MFVKSLLTSVVLYAIGAYMMSGPSEAQLKVEACLDSPSELDFYYCTGRIDLYYNGGH